jgi:putative transposase
MQNQMAHPPESELLNTVLQLLTEQGHSGFAEGIRLLVNEAMRQERASVLQAQPYERTDARLGHANGYKPKTVASGLGSITFQVPQVRGDQEFYPSALEKGRRSEQALNLALAEMYVQGVSTRKVSAIVEQLCGVSVSSTQVSQCAARLDAHLQDWRQRALGVFAYLVLDARYEKVRQGGQLLDCAVLMAMGIGPDGKRQILGVSAVLSEAEVHWRAFLQSLQARGLCGVEFIVTPACARPAPPSFPPCPGNAASFIFNGTPRLMFPVSSNAPRSPKPSAASSTPPIARPPICVSRKWPAPTLPPLPSCPPGWRKTCPKG